MDEKMLKEILYGEREVAKQVFVRGKKIIFNMPRGMEYPVPLKECSDAAGILNWARHISEKEWVTREMLREFFELAASKAGIERR